MYKCSVCLLFGDNRFYDIDMFSSYADIETEEVQEVLGLPDGVALNAETFDAVKTFSLLSDDDQSMMVAYYEATGSFDWEEAQEAYVGSYADGADFAKSLCEEAGYIHKDFPDWIVNHIDWQAVWDAELHHDYFEYDGYYFRNI